VLLRQLHLHRLPLHGQRRVHLRVRLLRRLVLRLNHALHRLSE
jgi:hypothetical protein